MRRYSILFLCLPLFISGCVWATADGVYKTDFSKYSVELPPGWMRLQIPERMLITRDGLILQSIMIEARPLENVFEGTSVKLRAGMSANEAADTLISSLKALPSIEQLEISEKKNTSISGLDAFRLTFTYTLDDNPRFKTLYYGFINGDLYYYIQYTAPERYYYDKDIQIFEKMLKTFTVEKRKASQQIS